MYDLNDLFYFAQVVEHGGFAPAGRALGIPKSRISRRIAELEARLDTRLIQRSTRHFSVTEAGQIYYTSCRAMLIEADAAEDAIAATRSEPCGVVRVTCPVALLDTRVGEMLANFMVAFPQVKVHLEETNRRVDVIEEGVDVAIRVRPPPLENSDLVLKILGDRGQCLVASPTLLAQFDPVRHPVDLSALPSLALGLPQEQHRWHLFGPDGEEVTVVHRPRLVTRGMMALRNAAVAGVGVVQLPAMMMLSQLSEKQLVKVIPAWAPRREIIHLVFPSRRGLLPAVRALIDYLDEQFKALDED
ncbi:LysR family transcriptional regulator [Cellvibrio polysaccharolyticus]|uniref:LysR family transcriptional regulator n=1 Tax=Cellvibrio polysaccharolyticus TaxID=2082724 RepID=A0A928V3U5_9GAMM|nr:LysR family transcriptional regulator [Cellvibrio polysaccharolyticus]MBE8718261.1 LysR family transcriptional regulator [Cellvibrio polysaccharolyticus]